MTDEFLIEADSISFSYSRPYVKALDDITFRIPPGSFTAVTGPNGSGKSTLIKLILGLLVPDSGTLRVMGETPWENPGAVQRITGYVPQTDNINDRIPLRVGEVVLQGAMTRRGGIARGRDLAARRESVLNMVDLADLSDRPFSALSGGQQQRTLIARALAVDPAVLILDEPFSAVDISSQQDIVGLLRKLADEHGVTIIAAVHNVNVLVHHLDAILLLNKKLVAFDTPDRVLKPEILKEAYGTDVPVVICDDGFRHPLLEDPHGRPG